MIWSSGLNHNQKVANIFAMIPIFTQMKKKVYQYFRISLNSLEPGKIFVLDQEDIFRRITE